MLKIKQFLLITFFACSYCTMNGQAYKSAVGVKAGNILAGTFKTFFGEKFAFEGLAGFGFDAVGTTNVNTSTNTRLYAAAFAQMYFPIESVDNLTWFVGVGPNISRYSVSRFTDANETSWGAAGIGGADYRIGDLPLNVSADISFPLFFNNGVDLGEPYIGASARYIFGEAGGSNSSSRKRR